MTGYVEYVRATGAQVIKTGFVPNGNTTIEAEWEPENTTNNQCLCSTRSAVSSTDTGAYCVFYLVQSGFDGAYRYDHYGTSINVEADTSARVTVETTKTSITIGGVTKTVPQSTRTSPVQMFLLASNSDTSGNNFGNYLRGKVYGFKIWDNGTLVRDFRPYEQNGVYGFFDEVTGTFYQSSGSPLMGPLKRIQYIEGVSTGETGDAGQGQYIDTGFKASGSTTRVELDAQLVTPIGCFFGSRTRNGASDSFTLFGMSSTQVRFDHLGTSNNIDAVPTERTFYEIGTNHITINGTRHAITASSRSAAYNMYLTSVNTGGVADKRAGVRIYSMRIYTDDTLVREYIPYKSGETAGMWETVSKTFHPSEGENEYIAGAVISTATWVADGATVRTDTDVVEGSALTPPDITKPGFRTDWYLDGVLVDFNSFVMPDHDVEFVASYYPLIVTLYLYDTGRLSIVEKNVGDLYILPEGEGSRGEFIGWMFNGELVTAITVPESSTTLFARYKESGTIIQIGFVSIQPNPSYVRETLLVSASVSAISTDVPLWTDMTITAESGLPMSSPYQVQIWDTSQPGPLAVFDGDGIKTTGMDVPPLEAQDTPLPRIGMWSEGISDSEGACDFVIHGSGSKVYTSSIVVYSSEDVQIREAEITYRNGNTSETQIATSSNDRIQFPSGTYTSFDIRVLRISKPYSHVRILNVAPGGT